MVHKAPSKAHCKIKSELTRELQMRIRRAKIRWAAGSSCVHNLNVHPVRSSDERWGTEAARHRCFGDFRDAGHGGRDIGFIQLSLLFPGHCMDG